VKALSSSLTGLYKIGFPIVFGGGFGLATMAMFASDRPDLQAIRWKFGGAWVFAIGVVLWTCVPLKRVLLDGATLVISNFRKEIRVPATEIEDVRQTLLLSSKPITVTFKRDTDFGRSITFIPPVSFRPFAEHRVVEDLRKLSRGELTSPG
jgi:hypothetical protein